MKCQTCHAPLRFIRVDPVDFKDSGARNAHPSKTAKLRCEKMKQKPMARTFFDPEKNRYVRRAA